MLIKTWLFFFVKDLICFLERIVVAVFGFFRIFILAFLNSNVRFRNFFFLFILSILFWFDFWVRFLVYIFFQNGPRRLLYHCYLPLFINNFRRIVFSSLCLFGQRLAIDASGFFGVKRLGEKQPGNPFIQNLLKRAPLLFLFQNLLFSFRAVECLRFCEIDLELKTLFSLLKKLLLFLLLIFF